MVDAKSSRAFRDERRGSGRDSAHPTGAANARLPLASGIGPEASCEGLERKVDSICRRVTDVDRPHLPPDRRQVLEIGDLLVAQEFGPRTIRRVRKVMC